MANELLALLQNEAPSWETLWDKEQSHFHNYRHLLRSSVALPEEGLQLDVATSLMLINSKGCPSCVPIVFCQGTRGSGKSTLAKLANIIRGYQQMFGPGDTFASLRNTLNQRKWADLEESRASGDEPQLESHGYLIAWDNLNAESLKLNQQLYSNVLLQGYDRSTGTAQIALPGGENMKFNVFSLKFITTIHPYIKEGYFEELKDRCFPVMFARNDELCDELLSLDSINWERFDQVYLDWWNNPNNAVTWAKSWQSVSRLKQPKNMKGRRWAISQPAMATYLAMGGCSDSGAALSRFADYWEWMDSLLGKQSLASGLLRQWLEADNALTGLRLQDLALGSERIKSTPEGFFGLPSQINCSLVLGYLESHRKAGNLDIDRLTASAVAQLMGELGYTRINVEGGAAWSLK